MVLNIRYECGVAGCPHTYWLATIGIRVRVDRGAAAHPRLGQSHYFSGKSYIFRAEASSIKMKKYTKNKNKKYIDR